jgi:DNA-directed RNA polymerase specialized sigma24 family protein
VVTEDAFARVQQASLLLRREREAALDRAISARKKLAEAQAEYAQAVLEASALGIANTKLAKSMGVSETAVRNFIARRKGA